jgi:hypothetical protein
LLTTRKRNQRKNGDRGPACVADMPAVDRFGK